MSEDVQKLRTAADELVNPLGQVHPLYGVMHDAAYEIARLEVQIAHLRAALGRMVEWHTVGLSPQDQIRALEEALSALKE